MDNSTHDMSEKLLQYLDGELPESERTELEIKLAGNEELRDELENLVLARQAVRSYGLKQHVTDIHQQMMNEFKPTVQEKNYTRRIVTYFMAAAAIILLAFLVSTLFNQGSPSAEKLFADIYRPYELTTTRGGSDASPVEKAYSEKNYRLVTTLTDTSAGIKNIFLSAMSYIELKDDAKAVEKLNIVELKNKNAGTSLLKDEAEYYLSLVYLRTQNYVRSLGLMNKIHNDRSHLYHEKITNELLRQVQKKLKN